MVLVFVVLLVTPASAAAARADRTPPTVPKSVKAVRGGQGIKITWAASRDARGVAKYLVYRDGKAKPVATRPASARSFTDPVVGAAAHWYVVRAVDRSGNRSRASVRVNVEAIRTITTAPPVTTIPTTPTPTAPTPPAPNPPKPNPPTPPVTPPVVPPVTPPTPPERPLWGYSAHMVFASDREEYAQLMRDSGATVARDDAWWFTAEMTKGTFDWTNNDIIVGTNARYGIRTLLIADTSPLWASGASMSEPGFHWRPPTNAADYGNYAGELAKRYGKDGTYWAEHPEIPYVPLAGIEIWNEPNVTLFWGGARPDPVHYTNMLKAAYAEIKAEDPTLTVLSAGLSPMYGYNDADCNGVSDTGINSAGSYSPINYLEAMYAAGAGGHMDALAYHPYPFNWPIAASTILDTHPCSAWSQITDTPVSFRSVMTANGDSAKKVWSTEMGVMTCVPGATYQCFTEEEQADIMARAVTRWRSFPWAGPFIAYNIRDDGTSTSDGEHHFGVTRVDSSLKPAFEALRDLYAD